MVLADHLSPPVRIHTLITGWQTGYVQLVALVVEILLVVGYIRASRRMSDKGRRWPLKRTVAFVGGMVLIAIAEQSGLSAYGDRDFYIYVIQHVALMNFAPILLALSAPITLALQASGRRGQRGMLKVLHNPVVVVITHPVMVTVVANVTMMAIFLTPLYQFSLRHPAVDDFVRLHYVVSGCLFWFMIVGIDLNRWRIPHPAKLGLMAVGIPVTAIIGLVQTGAKASIAPAFDTLSDTHIGGSIFWVSGELTTLVAMGLLLGQWMAAEERKAQRADRLADAEAGTP